MDSKLYCAFRSSLLTDPFFVNVNRAIIFPPKYKPKNDVSLRLFPILNRSLGDLPRIHRSPKSRENVGALYFSMLNSNPVGECNCLLMSIMATYVKPSLDSYGNCQCIF